jgi:uncharacterized protein (DUF1800 family)
MFESAHIHYAYSFFVRLIWALLLICALSIPTVSTATAAPNDFNLDNKSDLVLSNANGLVDLWLMNGTTVNSRTTILNSPGWAVSHLADFNGDGKTDILWRNINGAVTVWLMDGVAVTAAVGLIGADANWSVSHTGDFNNDGKADLLWRNTNGAVTLWLMNGTTVTTATGLLGANPDWRVTHVADLNGDKNADLVWRNTNGAVTVWTMTGTTITGSAGLIGADANWSVSHTADFNGDGRADLLWRNTNGAVTAWLMNGIAIASTAGLLGPDPNWSVSHTADFNGDGKADLLWRNSNGAVTIWTMNGITRTAAAGVLGPDANWRVAQTLDLNGDNKADLVWRANDGSITTWLMNGTTTVSTAGLLGGGSSWNAVLNTGNPAPVITANKLPTVSLTTPTSGANFAVGTAVSITPAAVDPDGIVTKVEFFEGSTKLGESTTAPFTFSWLPNSEGAKTITAKATDNSNGVSASLASSVNITASSTINASRLLAQATFGATREEIDRVAALGAAAYLEEQFGRAQTSHLTTVRNDPRYPTEPYAVMQPSIWKQYFEANDQLRQRMVFALSQILVISQQNNTIGDAACGTASYLDILGKNAFGNFRDLLKEVTLSPAMGHYLDMKQSAKADATLNSIPNENYARELMQLFSIGTVMLNNDGSPQFVNGKTVETYSEETAQAVARALTGWTYAGQDQTKSWRWLYPDVPYPQNVADGIKACDAWSKPMEPWAASYRSADDKRDITGGAHDTGAKTLLTYPGSDNFKKNIPANQTPMQDIDAVIDNVFNHPNVGPFIGELLIQRLVTSNPSGAYVSRVANAFNNNGAGVRGDMKAVIRAILLDAEARTSPGSLPASFGKLREPVVRFVQFHRAFNAKMVNGNYASLYDFTSSDSLGQNPLRAGSVFNFYSPEFAPSGPISKAGLVGPEFGITNSATISGFMDFSKYAIINGYGQYESDKTKWIQPNYDFYIALAPNPPAMVDQLNSLLLSGQMSSQFRTKLIEVATKLTDSNITTQNAERFKLVLWLILNSPEYSIQK